MIKFGCYKQSSIISGFEYVPAENLDWDEYYEIYYSLCITVYKGEIYLITPYTEDEVLSMFMEPLSFYTEDFYLEIKHEERYNVMLSTDKNKTEEFIQDRFKRGLVINPEEIDIDSDNKLDLKPPYSEKYINVLLV